MHKKIVFAFILFATLVSSRSFAEIEVSPLNQVAPEIERWGWDIKAWPSRLNSASEADFLFHQTSANLLRVPIFANAHGEDGSVNSAEYATEVNAMRSVQRVKPETEIFASLKLLGGDTYPDWLGDGTLEWRRSNGNIFGNTVERPNPEHYAGLLADYVEYMQGEGIKIDYLGINNETDTALNVDRYVGTIDLLNAELIARGVPAEYRNFQLVGPETFGLNSAENIVRDLANRNRLDTIDIVGSHFYPQHSSGNETSWSDIAQITGGVPMWHTEVHMPTGHANYVDDRQQAYRDTLSLLFAVNKRGVNSFVWWDSGHEGNKINDTIKREINNTTLGAYAIETSPGFTAKGDPDDEPLFQAFVNEDLLTVWIANPGDSIFSETIDLGEAVAISEPKSTFWQGTSTTITRRNTGSLDILVASDGELLLNEIPGDATMFLQFRFALGEGDYNRDGLVNLADYELWSESFGSQQSLLADGNNDGLVDAADFTIWRDAYQTAFAVPEPSGCSMIASILLVACLNIRRGKGAGCIL